MSNGEFDPQSNDATFARLNLLIDRLEKVVEKQEARISALEKRQYLVMGMATAVGFMFKAAWEYFTGGGKH